MLEQVPRVIGGWLDSEIAVIILFQELENILSECDIFLIAHSPEDSLKFGVRRKINLDLVSDPP